MSATKIPMWLQDLVREVGPVVVGELVKMGADALMHGKLPSLDADIIAGAKKVRDILPDPLPNVAVDDMIDAEIERRRKPEHPFAGIFEHEPKADPEADTDPRPPATDVE